MSSVCFNVGPMSSGPSNVECEVGTAGAADALGDEVDRERRRAVGGDDAGREGVVLGGRQFERQHAVLQAPSRDSVLRCKPPIPVKKRYV